MRWRLILIGMMIASPALAQPAVNDFAADEALLRGQGLPTKGVELLQILRDRTPSDALIAKFKDHVSHLNASNYTVRLQATENMRKMGPVVRPLLENLLRDTNTELETLRRLRHVLDQFPAEKDFATMSAAARLIQRDKPAGSLPVLLTFVPYATDEYVRQDVQQAIELVALVDKKPAQELLDALKSEVPARRAAAAEALIRTLGKDAKELVTPLLKDPHPLIRYQLGMALVEKHDTTGLPLLIDAINDARAERVEFALGLLYRAAGENAPVEPFGKNNLEKFTASWKAWHDKHGAKVDLPKQLATTEAGFTVITCSALKVGAKNRIFEIGPAPANEIRWEFDGPRYPLDIQILGPNRLLMAEYFDRRVTERDFKGNILKQFGALNPIAAQRLPNGHTFIVTRQQLQIVDGDGRETFTYTSQPGVGTINAAVRLRNGQMVVVNSGGRCVLLDPQGRELKGFQLGNIYTLGGNIEVLPNGRILAPLYTQQCVAEFDWNGNKLWHANVARPISATRLSNGNTLVTCSIDYRVVEIDANGKEVWSYSTDGSRPFRARRR